MKLSEIKKLIAKKLYISIDHILLCDRMSEEAKDKKDYKEKTVKDAYGQGIVLYKYMVNTKIPIDMLKTVMLFKETDISIYQFDKNNI